MLHIAIPQLPAGICPCEHKEAHMEQSVFGAALADDNVTYISHAKLLSYPD